MVSKEPVMDSPGETQFHQQLLVLQQRVDGLDELLRISGAGLEEIGVEICSACGDASVAGERGETMVVVHCATSVP